MPIGHRLGILLSAPTESEIFWPLWLFPEPRGGSGIWEYKLDSSLSFACARDSLSLSFLPAVGAGTPHTGLTCGRNLGASAAGKLDLMLCFWCFLQVEIPQFCKTFSPPGVGKFFGHCTAA